MGDGPDTFLNAATSPLRPGGTGVMPSPQPENQSLLEQLLPKILPALVMGAGAALTSPVRSAPLIAGRALLGGAEGWQFGTPTQKDMYYHERMMREKASFQQAQQHAMSIDDPELRQAYLDNPKAFTEKYVLPRHHETMSTESRQHLATMGVPLDVSEQMTPDQVYKFEYELIGKEKDLERMTTGKRLDFVRALAVEKLKQANRVSPFTKGLETERGKAAALREQGEAMDKETDRLESEGADPQIIKRRRVQAGDLKSGHSPLPLGAQTAEDVAAVTDAKLEAERKIRMQAGDALEKEANALRATDPERAMRLDAQVAQLKAGTAPKTVGGLTGREVAAHTEAAETAKEPFRVAATERKDASATALEQLKQGGREALVKDRGDQALTLETQRQIGRQDLEGMRTQGQQALETLRQGGRLELEGARATDREHLQGLQAVAQQKIETMRETATRALQTNKAEDRAKAQRAQIDAQRALEDLRFDHRQSREAQAREREDQLRQPTIDSLTKDFGLSESELGGMDSRGLQKLHLDMAKWKAENPQGNLKDLKTDTFLLKPDTLQPLGSNEDPSTGETWRVKVDPAGNVVAKVGRPPTARGEIDPGISKHIATGMFKGDQPPEFTQLYRYGAPVRAELEKMGMDVSTAQRQWKEVQRAVATARGPQQLRLRQAVDFTYESSKKIEELFQDWKRLGGSSGYPLLNKGALIASKQVPGELGATAQALEAQINDLTGELANVYMGGGVPTEQAMELAAKNLQADFNEDQFKKSMEVLRFNLGVRHNILEQSAVIPGNPYSAPTPASGGAAAGVIDLDAIH